MQHHLVSVAVPNYNGAGYLRGCLGSLLRQTYPSLEVILVDDGSSDNSVALVRSEFPEVRLVQRTANGGFARAANDGIRAAAGDIVALLNNDAEAEPRWVEHLVEALDNHPEAGFCASKLLLFERPTTINSAGDYYGIDGLPGNRGVWEGDRGQYDCQEYVFGACAGAAAFRRSVLQDVGLFDESFFMYFEDVDLSFRAQLMGYRCLYVPQAKVFHRLSATGGGSLASYYCGRNGLAVLAKNMPSALVRRYWTRILWGQLRLALRAARHWREPAARATLAGQVAGLRWIPCLLGERRRIQGSRRVSDGYITELLASSQGEEAHATRRGRSAAPGSGSGALHAASGQRGVGSCPCAAAGGRPPEPAKDRTRGAIRRSAADPGGEEPYLSVVIPAYNEEGRLPASLARLQAFVAQQPYRCEVVVVDDGSTDATAAVVEEMAATWEGLRLLREPHRGKGHAVKEGMLTARGRFVVFADADFSMPVDQLPRFPEELDGRCQVAIGSREAPGARRYGEPSYRHVMGRVFNWVVRLLVLQGFQDTQCGFKGFTRESAREIFRRVSLDGFGFDVEALYVARKLGYEVSEMPVDWYCHPSSRVDPLRDTIGMLGDVLRVRLNDRAGKYR